MRQASHAFPYRTPSNQLGDQQYGRGYQSAMRRAAEWPDARIGVSLKVAHHLILTAHYRLGMCEYLHGMADGLADLLARRHADQIDRNERGAP